MLFGAINTLAARSGRIRPSLELEPLANMRWQSSSSAALIVTMTTTPTSSEAVGAADEGIAEIS